MTQNTIDKLNKINKDFYFRISKYWNNKDDSAWFGWYRIVEIIDQKFRDKKEIRILDLGCGNARFATFIANSFLEIKIDYIGIDSDSEFLKNGLGRENKNFSSFKLIQADLITDNWVEELTKLNTDDNLNNKNATKNTVIPGLIGNPPTIKAKATRYDLIVLFGVLHHIPSLEARQNLLNQAAELLDTNGLLIFTGWRFLDKDRLRKRIIDPAQLFYQHVLNCFELNKTELENNDYLLDWVNFEYSIRYAHYISEAEAHKISDLAKLKINTHFIDDSLERDQNNYWIYQRESN